MVVFKNIKLIDSMKRKNPQISVLLPAFNAGKYIESSIQSILNQTYSNFELIILNDGSSDSTEEIIKSFKDSRIIYVKNEQNIGLVNTLNKGLKLANGKYIARMDADDISYIDRFSKQYLFLENNPSYIICSSSRKNFNDSNNREHISYMPVSDSAIRISSIFSSPFTHPAVMFRKEIILKNNLFYDENFKYSEDYEFWTRILKHGKGYNFNEVLLAYRKTPGSQTFNSTINFKNRKKIISSVQDKAIKSLGIELNKDELDFIFYLSLSVHIRQINFNKYPIEFIQTFFSSIESKLSQRFKTNTVLLILGKRYLKILLFNSPRLNSFQKLKLAVHKLTFFGLIYLIKERLIIRGF